MQKTEDALSRAPQLGSSSVMLSPENVSAPEPSQRGKKKLECKECEEELV